jgi:hypothetical protein
MLPDAVRARTESKRPPPFRAYVVPILAGLLIVAAGLVPWTVLARINASVRPEFPWAALVTLGYVGILLAWLNGWGPPEERIIGVSACGSGCEAPRRVRVSRPKSSLF